VKIRIGFGTGARTGVETQESFRLLVDELERLRFDSLWVSERLAGPGPDPVVAMSMAAARTERLKFGMSVMVLPGRNPVVTAKELASLDVLSGGRLVPAFGLGAPQLAEHQAFGVKREERAKIFDEALRLMRRLWTEDVVTHHGERFHIDDVRVLPKPLQQPLDVWLGGIAPSELRRVGRLADGWLPSFVTPDDVRAGMVTIREVAEANGRGIEDEHFGVLIPYANEPIDEEALGFLRKRRPDLKLDEMAARSVEDLAPLIERFVEVGASKFVVVPFAPMSDITAELEELASVVRPLEN
jgi:probable F420-dependent oxidoreductase